MNVLSHCCVWNLCVRMCSLDWVSVLCVATCVSIIKSCRLCYYYKLKCLPIIIMLFFILYIRTCM